MRSLELAGLGEMSLTERSDGRGSLVFGRETTHRHTLGSDAGSSAAPSFDMIEAARSVQQLIREAAVRLSR